MENNQHHIPKLGYGLSRLLSNVSEERKDANISHVKGLGKGLSLLLGATRQKPTSEKTEKGDSDND